MKVPNEISKSDATTSLLPRTPRLVLTEQHRDANEESYIERIETHKESKLRFALYVLGIILTGGALYLFCRWNEKLYLIMNYYPVDEEHATALFIKTRWAEEIVDIENQKFKGMAELRTFEFRHLPYVVEGGTARPLVFEIEVTKSMVHRQFGKGINDVDSIEDRRELYGKCEIDVEVPSIFDLLIDEILDPFYIFQLCSVVLWMWDGYRLYAGSIIVMSFISAAFGLYETRTALMHARNMAQYECQVTVIRNGETFQITSNELVPGDLFVIPENTNLPCDAILLQGDCVTNESMLTGESVPVLKDALPNMETSQYSFIEDRRHSLYSGTTVLQTRNNARGVVSRTGFMTMKGKLIRSILYPKPNNFKFYRDGIRFVFIMFLFAVVGYFVVLHRMLLQQIDDADMIDRALDLITVTVEPILPAVMTIGSAFAMARLKKKNINCSSPHRVNVAGRISTFMFDKTGTLTEDCMDFFSQNASKDGVFIGDGLQLDELSTSMAVCHSLTMIKDQLDGEPQELKIFESTGWELTEETDPRAKEVFASNAERHRSRSIIFEAEEATQLTKRDPQTRLGIAHIFHFNSKVKRMGVVTVNLVTNEYVLHMKGAPEFIYKLCVPGSVPPSASQVQSEYTQKGLRVLAYGYKKLPNFDPACIGTIKMEDIEADLTFLGLISLQNKLKPETTPALKVLNEVRIDIIMATGDAALTGIAVAAECQLIADKNECFVADYENGEMIWTHWSPGLASVIAKSNGPENIPWIQALKDGKEFNLVLIGQAFEHYRNKAESGEAYDVAVFKSILIKAKVFARMSPEHKAALVEGLQDRGELVGMCGDGANDCGALSAADIGISLSEAEASIAAPFTSSIPNIGCVLITLIEGRCALATSFQAFKYIELYSMTQYVVVLTLYWIGANLTDDQYLVGDLFTILPLSIFMSYTDPYHKLTKEQPMGDLISYPVLLSVIGQTFIQAGTQLFAFWLMTKQDFFEPVVDWSDKALPGYWGYLKCWENTIMFMTSTFIYLAVCMVYSIGKPHRRPAWTNYWFTASLVILFSLYFYVLLYPDHAFMTFFGLEDIPQYFRWVIFGIDIGYLIVALAFERIVVNNVSYAYHKKEKKKRSKKADDEIQGLLSLS